MTTAPATDLERASDDGMPPAADRCEHPECKAEATHFTLEAQHGESAIKASLPCEEHAGDAGSSLATAMPPDAFAPPAPEKAAKAAEPWVLLLTHRSLGNTVQVAKKGKAFASTSSLHFARRFATRAEVLSYAEANRAAIVAAQFSAYSWDTEANVLPWKPEA